MAAAEKKESTKFPGALAHVRDVRITSNATGDPVLHVDLTLHEGGGRTDKIVVRDAGATPTQRKRVNASVRRLRALCREAGVDLGAVLPVDIKDSGDFEPLVAALKGRTVGVDVTGKRVRYVGTPESKPRPAACEEAPPELVYYTSGTHEGELIPCAANAMAILATDPAWQGVLAFDEFEGTVVALKRPPWYTDSPASARWKAGPLRDTDTTRAHAWFARKHHMVLSTTAVYAAINAAAESNVVHPVREYLSKLRWDRKPRLDTWLVRYGGATDTPYVRAVSAAWLISAVARVFQPGCKADHMLVLQGEQGVGKSSMLEALVPNRDWFNDEFNTEGRDAKLTLRGVWIVEAGELAGMKKAEVETIKAFITRRVDKYRDPYGHRDGRHQRQCIGGGTTNAREIFRDDSGNRRFWPVEIVRVDLEALKADRDMLWAEAVERYQAHEPWHLIGAKIIEAAKEEQEERLIADPRSDMIASYLAGSRVDERDAKGNVTKSTPRRALGVSTKEVLLGPLQMQRDRAGQGAQLEAARLLRQCDWATCAKKHTRGATRTRLYFPKQSGCRACLERWDTAPQAADGVLRKEMEKTNRQSGQIGHHPEITPKSGARSLHGVLGKSGASSGAGKPAHVAPPDSFAAEVATSRRLTRGRGRRKRSRLPDLHDAAPAPTRTDTSIERRKERSP